MPIHWTPTRRRFAGTIAATAAASLLPSRNASADDPDSETWALLADTHIAGDPGRVVRGVNMHEHLERIVSSLVAEADSLDGILVDGDCALDAGYREDYELLAATLEPIAAAGVPVHLTLGNHDDRGPFSEIFTDPPAAVDAVANKHVSLVETPHANWILLDSLRIVDEVAGEFGPEQVAWLDETLADRPDKPAILAGHHYPQVREKAGNGEPAKIVGLADTEAFLSVARKHAHAQAYLYGHSHSWQVTTDESGLHHVNLPPTAYVFEETRPAGWVRATVSRRKGLTVELVSLDPAHEQHGERFELPWR